MKKLTESRFEPEVYESILKRSIEFLAPHNPERILSALVVLTSKAIESDVAKSLRNQSRVWRPILAPRDDIVFRHNHSNVVASELYDCLTTVAARGLMKPRAVLSILRQSKYSILRRLGLAYLAHCSFAGQTRTALLSRANITDPEFQLEYAALAAKHFASLSDDDRRAVLAIVNAPPKLTWLKAKKRPDERLAHFTSIWRRDRLYALRDWLEPGERLTLDKLVGEYGLPPNPENLLPHATSFGPGSPLSVEDFASLSASETFDYLQAWRPATSSDIFADSPEGLARQLTSTFVREPEKYYPEMSRFASLEPTYVRAVVSAVTQILRAGGSLPWSQTLEFLAKVLSRNRSEVFEAKWFLDRDPGWTWTRVAIAHFLQDALRIGGTATVPFSFRDLLWSLLQVLSEDSDPTPDENRQPFRVHSTSTNTVRGSATAAVIDYAYWVWFHSTSESERARPVVNGFKVMPEVRIALDKLAADTIPAVRAVLGQRFGMLAALDEHWAAHASSMLFPTVGADDEARSAAWQSFLVFCNPSKKTHSILVAQYEFAASKLPYIDPATDLIDYDSREQYNRLTDHIMTFWYNGVEELDGALVSSFYRFSPDRLRAHAMSFIGRSLAQEQPNERLQERLARFLEWRLEEFDAGHNEMASELSRYGWWYISGRFPKDEAAGTLLQILERTKGIIDPGSQVIEQILKEGLDQPTLSLGALALLSGGKTEFWSLLSTSRQIRDFLREASTSDDPAVKPLVDEVRSYLITKGFQEFASLDDQSP